MTRKYLPLNQYGLNPKHAEVITSKVEENKTFQYYFESIGVELRVERGFIDGEVDEYDHTYPVKDTIVVKVDGNILGRLFINSTELLLAPKYTLTKADFIQVSFFTMKTHPLTSRFLGEQLPFANNGVGESIYSFLILSKEDLEEGANIILSKLSEKIVKAKEQYNKEEREFIEEVRSKYSTYLANK